MAPIRDKAIAIGFLLFLCVSSNAFVVIPSSNSPLSTEKARVETCRYATESSELFKAGLLCDNDSRERAVELVSRKIRKISDLGWKGVEAKRRSSIRPKLWPFGGSNELAIQDKANYSPDNPNCPDPWLGLEEFYGLVGDDTAAADLIFVSLAGGRAFVERDIAESVLDRWWGTTPSRGKKAQFNRDAFEQTVKDGQRDFIIAWSMFLGATGTAVAGIAFPTNPLQLALVDLVDYIF